MINGIYAASLSILNDDLELDYKKTTFHAEQLIDNGCHGVVFWKYWPVSIDISRRKNTIN